MGGPAVVFLGSIFLKTLNMHSRVKSLLKTSILTYIAIIWHIIFPITHTVCCFYHIIQIIAPLSYTNKSCPRKKGHLLAESTLSSFRMTKKLPVWPSQRLANSVLNWDRFLYPFKHSIIDSSIADVQHNFVSASLTPACLSWILLGWPFERKTNQPLFWALCYIIKRSSAGDWLFLLAALHSLSLFLHHENARNIACSRTPPPTTLHLHCPPPPTKNPGYAPGVGVLRGQRHIPSRTWSKYPSHPGVELIKLLKMTTHKKWQSVCFHECEEAKGMNKN